MLILLIALSLLLIISTIYILYYRNQIKDIGNQLAFITKHHSFKLIHTQIKPKEISHLIDRCNVMLKTQREMDQQFIKKNEEINSTIASLSHDIRTPLTSLDGYLQLATRTESPQEKSHYIKLAQSRTERINRLLDELFLYTKLENKDYTLDMENIDIVNLIQQRLFVYINEFSQKGYEPAISLPEHPVYIQGNSSAIERILENVIRNYLLHGEGAITIHCEENSDAFIIHFTNAIRDGISINPESIFTRFYKEDASRTNHSSGLGLFIVKTLMEKMQGDVSASVEQDRFCLRLVFNKTGKEESYVGSTDYLNHRR
ncbi:sensor histidine kinase [Oceanobacillus kapialis]|uniref:sensor histidine kinase n=1 Tax=Oceanobacillus kapialis TaxID=481353 RepID=UPI00384DF6C7